MTKEQALKELEKCLNQDQEGGHIDADNVLCELLTTLGYGEVVDAYHRVPKWFA